MRRRFVEIISVGNELLTGHTLNTNAHWIAKEVTEIGGTVRRVTVVRDEMDAIVPSIRESLARRPSWIIITGGLGPTYDDKTLQGLAEALGRRLVLNKKAVAMLRRKYSKRKSRAISPELTPPRLKMATLPAGAKPIENPVGLAPSVMVKRGSCTIFALPGVPRDVIATFAKQIKSLMKREIGKVVRLETTLETKGVMESVLAPYLERIVAGNPRVYIKSHPRGFERGVPFLHINISGEARSRELASRYLMKAAKAIRRSVIDAGGKVRKI